MRYFTVLAILIAFTFTPVSAQPEELSRMESKLPRSGGNEKIVLLNKLSWGYRRISTEKALDYANKAHSLSMDTKFAEGNAFACKNLGTIYSIRGEYDKSSEWLGSALEKFSKLQNTVECGNIHNLLGLLYWEQGNHASAISHYQLADQLYTKAHDYEGRAIVLGNIGIIFYEQNNYDEALSNYTEALEVARSSGNKLYAANLHTNIGLIYKELENYEKTLEHYNASLVLDREEGNLSGIAKSYTNLGECYFGMNQLDKSFFYNNKALAMYEKIGEPKGTARSLMNMGKLEQLAGDLEKAEKTMRQALHLSREMNDRLGVAIALCSLGSIQLERNETSEAIVSLSKAHALAKELSSAKYRAVSSLLLAKAYEKNGETDQAVLYYKEYNSASDSLSDERSNSRLTELQIGFETSDKQKEIERLESAGKANSVKKKMAVYGGIGIALLAAITYAWQRKKYNSEKNEITGQLISEQVRGKRLASSVNQMAIELEENRRSLLLFARSLSEKNTAAEDYPVRKAPDPEVLEELGNSRIITEDDWLEFRQRFNKVFPGFMSSLKEKFPTVTTAELRMAALMRLQLNSHEAAAILGISGDSVKKLRQRLRRKIGIDPGITLNEALNDIDKRFTVR